jgi:hypothetical protein
MSDTLLRTYVDSRYYKTYRNYKQNYIRLKLVSTNVQAIICTSLYR